jgi:hypothetical protein
MCTKAAVPYKNAEKARHCCKADTSLFCDALSRRHRQAVRVRTAVAALLLLPSACPSAHVEVPEEDVEVRAPPHTAPVNLHQQQQQQQLSVASCRLAGSSKHTAHVRCCSHHVYKQHTCTTKEACRQAMQCLANRCGKLNH